MAYYSQQGAQINQAVGAAGRLMAYQDGSLGIVAPRTARTIQQSRRRRRSNIGRGRRRATNGLGDYFESPPVAMAFKDGVFGYKSQLDENHPGPLMAHTDGSLGSLGMPLFINGEQVDQALSITHGSRPAVDGGVLGAGAGPASAISDGGTLGAGAAEGSGSPEAAPEPLISYRDGILGHPDYVEQMPGQLFAYGDGVVGNPRYERPAWNTPVSGLGAVSDPRVVNLRDAATLREVKYALAFAMADVTMTQTGQATYTAAFYDDPIWGAVASDLMGQWVSRYMSQAGADVTGNMLAVTEAAGMYPTPLAIMTMISQSIGSPGNPGNPAWFQSNFPILSRFSAEVVQSGSDLSQFTVIPPYFTLQARSEGEASTSMSTLALVGLGAVGAIGAAVVVTSLLKRKRRR